MTFRASGSVHLPFGRFGHWKRYVRHSRRLKVQLSLHQVQRCLWWISQQNFHNIVHIPYLPPVMKKTRPDWSGIFLGSKLELDMTDSRRVWFEGWDWWNGTRKQVRSIYPHLQSHGSRSLHHPACKLSFIGWTQLSPGLLMCAKFRHRRYVPAGGSTLCEGPHSSTLQANRRRNKSGQIFLPSC